MTFVSNAFTSFYYIIVIIFLIRKSNKCYSCECYKLCMLHTPISVKVLISHKCYKFLCSKAMFREIFHMNPLITNQMGFQRVKTYYLLVLVGFINIIRFISPTWHFRSFEIQMRKKPSNKKLV